MNFLNRFRSEEGATATEYVFLLVFIALAITIGAGALGTAINGGMNSAATSVTSNTGGGGTTSN